MIRRAMTAAWIALGLGLIAVPIVTATPSTVVCADEACRSALTGSDRPILL